MRQWDDQRQVVFDKGRWMWLCAARNPVTSHEVRKWGSDEVCRVILSDPFSQACRSREAKRLVRAASHWISLGAMKELGTPAFATHYLPSHIWSGLRQLRRLRFLIFDQKHQKKQQKQQGDRIFKLMLFVRWNIWNTNALFLALETFQWPIWRKCCSMLPHLCVLEGWNNGCAGFRWSRRGAGFNVKRWRNVESLKRCFRSLEEVSLWISRSLIIIDKHIDIIHMIKSIKSNPFILYFC